MLIKQQQLKQHLRDTALPLYLLIGQEPYLLNDSLDAIKNHLKVDRSCDETKIHIQSASDWSSILEQANNLSLFYDFSLITAHYEKKTLDAEGKKTLSQYLASVNPKTFIIIQAPNLTGKQLQWLQQDKQACIVQSYPLDASTMKQWVTFKLKEHAFQFSPEIPETIFHYTKGNMLATSQCIEKLALIYEANTVISKDMVQEQLTDQSEYTLYELMDALLQGNTQQVRQIIQKISQDKTEPTLVLWMITQELRLLAQLMTNKPSNELKIWPQRARYYQACRNRMQLTTVHELLKYCQLIDEQIKSFYSGQVWLSLENLALSISLGTLVGDTTNVVKF